MRVSKRIIPLSDTRTSRADAGRTPEARLPTERADCCEKNDCLRERGGRGKEGGEGRERGYGGGARPGPDARAIARGAGLRVKRPACARARPGALEGTLDGELPSPLRGQLAPAAGLPRSSSTVRRRRSGSQLSWVNVGKMRQHIATCGKMRQNAGVRSADATGTRRGGLGHRSTRFTNNFSPKSTISMFLELEEIAHLT